MVEVKHISYKIGNKEVEGLFIETPKGFLCVNVSSGEFFDLPKDAVIEDVEISVLGRL